MWPILTTAIEGDRPCSTPRDVGSALLSAGCSVLASTSPALVSATSISCAVPSPEEGELLAIVVRRLAKDNRLMATVTVRGKRLRVRLARLESVQESQYDER